VARKRKKRAKFVSRTVTAERAARLYRLLKLLGNGSQTRTSLTRRLRLDVRGFYRDLELLRAAGISVPLTNRRYGLTETVEAATASLPFPDPHLVLGEAIHLAKGRSQAHRKLRALVRQIVKNG
jgi:predicted DNA-binding transcriptional regulator YafY